LEIAIAHCEKIIPRQCAGRRNPMTHKGFGGSHPRRKVG
jgi:hypothetical protein